MFNLVAINLKGEQGSVSHTCSVNKCPNPGRYQIYKSIEAEGLPDWEGRPICSKHLVEEARHRPEIIMSLLDILIDAMEQSRIFQAPSGPLGAGGGRVVPIRGAGE